MSHIGFAERYFRFQSSQIKELRFSPPASGELFSMPWQLEALLQNGKTRVWKLAAQGVPRAQIEGVRALKIPVHIG